jgi:hypothetical protein
MTMVGNALVAMTSFLGLHSQVKVQSGIRMGERLISDFNLNVKRVPQN